MSEPKGEWPHGYSPAYRKACSDYYDVEKTIAFLDTPVPQNHHRWRCILCGWALDVNNRGLNVVAACGCGGCGMTALRPIAEWNTGIVR